MSITTESGFMRGFWGGLDIVVDEECDKELVGVIIVTDLCESEGIRWLWVSLLYSDRKHWRILQRLLV